MKKEKIVFVFLVLVSCVYLVYTQGASGELNKNIIDESKVSAAKIETRAHGSLEENPLYSPEEDWIIDPEYNFVMRYSDQVGYDLGKSVNVIRTTSKQSNVLKFNGPTGSALITNIGVYKGEWINLRINLLGIDKYDDLLLPSNGTQNNCIYLDNKSPNIGFLSYSLTSPAKGGVVKAELEYVIEDSKGNRMDLGFFGGVNIPSASTVDTIGIKFHSTTKIHQLTQWKDDGSNPNYYENSSGILYPTTGKFGYLGYQVKNLRFTASIGSGFSSILFASVLPGSIGIPAIAPRNQTFNDASFTTPVDIKFEQNIPALNTSNPIKSYEWAVTTADDPYYEYKDIEIHNFKGEDSSSLFSVSKTGNEIKIIGKDVSNQNFYDNFYVFSFNYKPKDGMTIPKKELGDDDSYLLSMEVDSNIVSTSRINFVDLDVPVTEVQLTPENVAIGIGERLKLQETVLPTDATNKNVSWKSSDISVVQVDVDGVVMGLKPGKVTITVETEDGGHIASTIVTVFEEGTLSFRESLNSLNFQDIILSSEDTVTQRKSEGPILSVLDTRWIKEPYSIQVSLGEPLSSLSGMILPDALFLMSSLGESKVLSQERIEVLHHQPEFSQSGETEEVQIEWSAEEGILLRMASNEMIPGHYSGLLNWHIVSGP